VWERCVCVCVDGVFLEGGCVCGECMFICVNVNGVFIYVYMCGGVESLVLLCGACHCNYVDGVCVWCACM